jgi:restriction endonuclease S subunit
MQSALPEDGIEYLEIGGNDIGPFGNIEGGTKKYIDEISEARLERARLRPGDLFLCIRGSVGKVCLMGPKGDIPTVPNQSFVKLSFKKNPKDNEINPELLFWWLNSAQCREMLASKALSQGVPRLSISDVEDLFVPIGPWALLELEYKKYKQWNLEVNVVLNCVSKAHSLNLDAFAIQQ